MPPCDRAWQWGETEMPGWVRDEVYMGLAALGLLAAGLQVVSGCRRGFKSMAHKGVQLIAAGDVLVCLWWLVVARHTVGDGGDWYKKQGTCKMVEITRTSTEVCAVFWTMMLSVLLVVDAHYFYQFEVVPREMLRVFAAVFFTTPLAQIVLVIWWKAKTPCRPSSETSKTEEAAEHVLTIIYLLMLTVVLVSVCYVFIMFRSKRTGVIPRLLFLPVSTILRGLAPILTFYGWFGPSCSSNWAGVWSIISPLLPVFNFLIYFARPSTLSILTQTIPPAETPVETNNGSFPASEDTSLLDLPLRIQQVHLDFLWGYSTQGLLFERRVKKGIHRGRSSAGSSFINSEPYDTEQDEGTEVEYLNGQSLAQE